MRFRYIIQVAVLSLLLSCTKGGGGEEAAIAFAQNPLFITSESGVYDCGLVCNAYWAASTKDAWITILTEKGASGEELKVRVSVNSEAADRTGSIKVTAGSAGKVLQLVQYGNTTSGFVSETNVSIDPYGTGTYISVNTESAWSYTAPSASWIVLERKGTAAIGISAEINYTGQPRSTSFKVRTDDGSREAEVTITQQFSNEKFLASTEYGRKLVYAMGGYIKSVSSDSYRVLTDGVSIYEMSCTLTDGLGGETSPRKRNIYLFEVDMTKASIVATLPNDDNTKINSTQKMSEQIPALQNKRSNLTVWGGTNGDFFSEDSAGVGTYTLQGILYRGGTCLKSSFAQTVNTIFAVFKDGTAKCMNQTVYNTVKDNIQEAVGGRQHLINNGASVEFSDGTQHPRTAVGTSADGKITWILVVDGRDELYSTGSFSVSYEPLARILKAAGARDAINLDGGGSSTVITRKAGGSSFERRNQPGNSGRLERAVLDGLAIVTTK